MRHGCFYQPKVLHVYQVIKKKKHALHIYSKLFEPNHWVKKGVSMPPFAWHSHLFFVCNFINMIICSYIYQHIMTYPRFCLSLSRLWFTWNTEYKMTRWAAITEGLIKTANFFVNVPANQNIRFTIWYWSPSH